MDLYDLNINFFLPVAPVYSFIQIRHVVTFISYSNLYETFQMFTALRWLLRIICECTVMLRFIYLMEFVIFISSLFLPYCN